MPDRLDPGALAERLTVLDASKLFAEAIRRLHAEEPLVDIGSP